jgi:SAM-dependent methyltransferase
MPVTWIPAVLRHPGQSLRSAFEQLRLLLADESDQTRDMLDVYRRSVTGNVTRDELQRANGQFADVLRMAGLGAFFVMVPGSMLLIPIAVKVASTVGVRILPDTFHLHGTDPSFDTPDAYLQWWRKGHASRTTKMTVVVGDTTLQVDPGVFNPCPSESHSAQVLLAAMEPIQDLHVLDLACGTGVLALHGAMAGAAQVTAVDIDPLAVANAKRNVIDHELGELIDVYQSDLFDGLKEAPQGAAPTFDVILANLPISEAAWPVDQAGVVQRFVQQVRGHLKPGGRAVFAMASFGNVDALEASIKDVPWTRSEPVERFGQFWWTYALTN